jgi:hypothetical protein
MAQPIRRIHALSNTFSGAAGEARVAAEFVRCGLRVAKPYWTDDEVDLLLLAKADNMAVPLAVQVKSVQFIQKEKTQERVFIQGLKKRYVNKSPAFAVAIYRVDSDEIFFVDSPENVISMYEAQKTWNKKHKGFDSLQDDDDVRIAVSRDNGIPGDWKIPTHDAAWLSTRVNRLAKEVVSQNKLIQTLSALWLDEPAQVADADDDSDIDESDESPNAEPSDELTDARSGK